MRFGLFWTVLLSVVTGTSPVFGQKSTRKATVCSITINSDHEIRNFKKILGEENFRYVELTDMEGKEGDQDLGLPDWLEASCQAGIECDLLVVSGHFAGSFFGESDLTLSMEDLEHASCQRACDGILKKPKESFLFGCNTLAGKGRDRRTPEQYRRDLIAHGMTSDMAEQIVAFLHSPLGDTFANRMSEVFSQTPRIYGFDGIGPSGQNVDSLLRNYLTEAKASGYYQVERLNQLRDGLNQPFFRNLRQTAVAQTSGSRRASSERPVCYLRDRNIHIQSRLQWAAQAMQSPKALEFLPAILDFFQREGIQWDDRTFEPFEDKKRFLPLRDRLQELTQRPLRGMLSIQTMALTFMESIGWMEAPALRERLAQLIVGDMKTPWDRERSDQAIALLNGKNFGTLPLRLKNLGRILPKDPEFLRFALILDVEDQALTELALEWAFKDQFRRTSANHVVRAAQRLAEDRRSVWMSRIFQTENSSLLLALFNQTSDQNLQRQILTRLPKSLGKAPFPSPGDFIDVFRGGRLLMELWDGYTNSSGIRDPESSSLLQSAFLRALMRNPQAEISHPFDLAGLRWNLNGPDRKITERILNGDRSVSVQIFLLGILLQQKDLRESDLIDLVADPDGFNEEEPGLWPRVVQRIVRRLQQTSSELFPNLDEILVQEFASEPTPEVFRIMQALADANPGSREAYLNFLRQMVEWEGDDPRLKSWAPTLLPSQTKSAAHREAIVQFLVWLRAKKATLPSSRLAHRISAQWESQIRNSSLHWREERQLFGADKGLFFASCCSDALPVDVQLLAIDELSRLGREGLIALSGRGIGKVLTAPEVQTRVKAVFANSANGTFRRLLAAVILTFEPGNPAARESLLRFFKEADLHEGDELTARWQDFSDSRAERLLVDRLADPSSRRMVIQALADKGFGQLQEPTRDRVIEAIVQEVRQRRAQNPEAFSQLEFQDWLANALFQTQSYWADRRLFDHEIQDLDQKGIRLPTRWKVLLLLLQQGDGRPELVTEAARLWISQSGRLAVPRRLSFHRVRHLIFVEVGTSNVNLSSISEEMWASLSVRHTELNFDEKRAFRKAARENPDAATRQRLQSYLAQTYFFPSTENEDEAKRP